MNQNPKIKAIETIYNGYRFRSRLEAKWAVFFDAIKWPYEYEPEGFTWSGQRYLPDFRCDLHLPTYFEIKPPLSAIDNMEPIDKWKSFALEFVNEKQSACIVFGSPWKDMVACYAEWCKEGGHVIFQIPVFITQCPCCKKPSLLTANHPEGAEFLWNAPGFNRAPYEKARSARFEHGEQS